MTRWLRSLRGRAFLIVLAVAIAPLLVVSLSSAVDRDVDRRMLAQVRDAAEEVAGYVPSSGPITAQIRDEIEDIADWYDVRVRVVDERGDAMVDLDVERVSLWTRAGDLFFGPDGAPTLAEFDATLATVPERPESRASRNAPVDGCRSSPQRKLLVCHAAVTVGGRIVYVQRSSRRAIRALYDLRYQLLKLTLFVIPFALGLAWWQSRRMVRPIERLRQQVAGKIESSSTSADLARHQVGEIDALAVAFNRLLERLRGRARDKEAFVADLAHEFKNPVAAIRAAAEALERDAADPKRVQRVGRVLDTSSRRLDDLLTQFLDLARAEAGLADEERASVDLGALAQGVVASFADDPAHREVTFECSRVDGEGGQASVPGVAGRLESVIRNLVDNAASFAGHGGTVTVSVERQADTVVLRVADDGPGIEADELPRVFDRFYTKRRASGASVRGTGLGLALVRAIVEAHDGAITVTSKPGAGATFVVALPDR